MTDTWFHSTHVDRLQPARRPQRTHHAPDKGHGAGCLCPACATLSTFVRPRFFAGQLLTDTELRLLEQYAIDKHRLHNLHLHGWGVVCGLQVLCDDCGDGVTVESGYAIDPCGNDIIVPTAQPVDVLKLIEACRAGDKPEPCDPPRWPTAEGCEREETWCLTVRYLEHHTRAVAPLGGAAKGGACGCGGCGGGGSCGCETGSSKGRAGWECECGAPRSAGVCQCQPAPTSPTRPADCEPSRTHELYEFGVCRSDGSCRDLVDRLAGTFPMKVVECIKELRPIFSGNISAKQQKDSASLLLGGTDFVSDDDAHDAVCALYEAVVELYITNPLRATCVLPTELTLLECTPRGEEESSEHYIERMQQVLQALILLVLAYLRDCICYHLMPPCPVDPCDDRVVLACMTVRDGKVVDICNFDCRRYAGSFVSRNYWLPIGPVLSWLAAVICCFPLFQGRRGKYIGTNFGQMIRMPTTARMRQAIMRNDYSMVTTARARLRTVGNSMRGLAVLDRLDRRAGRTEEEIDLGGYLNMPADEVASSLHKASVPAEFLSVESGAVPSFAGIGLFPTVAHGTPVVAYTRGDRVVAFAVRPEGDEGDRPPPTKRPSKARKRGPR